MKALAILAALALTTPAFAADSLADIAWITGQWRATQGDGAVVTETWLPAEGGVMPGISRTIEGGKGRVEFMRIDEKGGQIAFTAIVGRQPPTTFVARSRSADDDADRPRHHRCHEGRSSDPPSPLAVCVHIAPRDRHEARASCGRILHTPRMHVRSRGRRFRCRCPRPDPRPSGA